MSDVTICKMCFCCGRGMIPINGEFVCEDCLSLTEARDEVVRLTARLAAAQVRNVCPECGLTPGAISTCVCEECVGELQERLAAAEALNKPRMSLHAEIARLQARLAAAEEALDEERSRRANVIGIRDTLAEQLTITKAALQPFAKVAEDIDPKLEDYMAHHYDHLVGHYRAAAEAVKGGRDE